MKYKDNTIQDVVDINCPEGRLSIPDGSICLGITSNFTIEVRGKLPETVQKEVGAAYVRMFESGKLNT